MSDTVSARSGSTGSKRSGGLTRKTGRGAKDAADSVWLKRLGQVGVVAIGIVYLLLAWICLQVAFGSPGKTADNTGALRELAGNPVGRTLLWVMSVGLLAYVVWQLALAAVDYTHEKDAKNRTVKRIGAVGKAIFGAAIGAQSLQLALRGKAQDSSKKQADWTGKLLGLPAGRVLVVVIGLAIIAFAALLAYRGVKKKFLEKLEGTPRRSVVRLGEVGWVARSVAFGVLGVLVVVAGVKSEPDKARGLDKALKTLADQPFGTVILTVVALGLAAYALFQFVTASTHKEG